MRPSFLELLRVLGRYGVDMIVVGGVAAILEGAPITTIDLDVVYRTAPDNFERLQAALTELEARYRDPAGRLIRPTLERLRVQRLNLLETNLGLLDALQVVGDQRSYDQLLPKTTLLRVEELEVRVLQLAEIIKTKEEAGRDKDLAALPVLRRTLELKKAR